MFLEVKGNVGKIFISNVKEKKCTNPEHLLGTDKDTSCLGYVRTEEFVLNSCSVGQIFH